VNPCPLSRRSGCVPAEWAGSGRSAETASFAPSVRPKAQPITRRENASSTTDKYTNSARNRIHVISAIESRLIAPGRISRAKFQSSGAALSPLPVSRPPDGLLQADIRAIDDDLRLFRHGERRQAFRLRWV
jgi:hypothetical protein